MQGSEEIEEEEEDGQASDGSGARRLFLISKEDDRRGREGMLKKLTIDSQNVRGQGSEQRREQRDGAGGRFSGVGRTQVRVGSAHIDPAGTASYHRLHASESVIL